MFIEDSVNIPPSLACVAVFALASIIHGGKDSARVFVAVVISQLFAFTPLYTFALDTNPPLTFLVYASVYFTAMNFLSSYKVLSACFIMAVFEVIMYKAYLNELCHKGIENGLYDNYEYIVTLLHLNILLSMVRWDIVRSAYRSIRDNLLRPFLYERCLLPY